MADVNWLRSIKNGTSEALIGQYEQIANLDNNTIGEDGNTEAMRSGYTISKSDSSYKEKACCKSCAEKRTPKGTLYTEHWSPYPDTI
jgi:hypothetical protein